MGNMQITIKELQEYLSQRYNGWANEQGLFMKLVEETGEVAEVLNQRSGRKSADKDDLQDRLGEELADMLHYIVAIASVNEINLTQCILRKDKRASEKYHHETNLTQFLSER